eukprot:tig00021126_g18460.t1
MFSRSHNENLGESLAARATEIRTAFNLLSKDEPVMPISALKSALQILGLDASAAPVAALLKKADPKNTGTIDFDGFYAIMADETENILQRALAGRLAIPNFAEFCEELVQIFEECREHREGANANYIPFLELVDPELYGIAICTVDGQRFSYGDAQVDFCMQSCIKPLTYCFACEERGIDLVHEHVGYEPSGVAFNAFTLNFANKPHNPMINSGAITVCSLLQPEASAAVRFATLVENLKAMAGGARIGFNQAVFLSEKDTADKNFALAYYMRSHGVFPPGARLNEVLDFYFQCCSIEGTCESMATMAATLANAGVCPTTGRRCVNPKTVRNCLALMYSCGMYDFSGEWAFSIGLPAKSGVSGAIFVVIPNVMGLAIYSPRLDRRGNSVRGIEFCKRLTERYSFSIFDQLVLGVSTKADPTASPNSSSYFRTTADGPAAAPQGAHAGAGAGGAGRRSSLAGAGGGRSRRTGRRSPWGPLPRHPRPAAERRVTFASGAAGAAPSSPGPLSASRLLLVQQKLSSAASGAPAPAPSPAPAPPPPPAPSQPVYTSWSPDSGSPSAGASPKLRGAAGPGSGARLTRVAPEEGAGGGLVSDLADSSPAFSRYKNVAAGFRS